jgi:hypothetical protein
LNHVASGHVAFDHPANAIFQAWLTSDAVDGPQRSYRLACRLADAMRRFGRTASIRAEWALAHSLFWHGRLEKSAALLASIRLDAINQDADAVFNHVPLGLLIAAQMSWNLALLGEKSLAIAHAEQTLNTSPQDQSTAMNRCFTDHARSLLHCFLDTPEATLYWSRQRQAESAEGIDPVLRHLTTLLGYWARSRLDAESNENASEASAQAALAALRRLGPAHEARGFSLYAQALYWQSPSHAATQLDAALALNARCGLHAWTARLLHLKARSLDAAGQLSEASRFLNLARETAEQQGARLFLDDITGIESRTYASPPPTSPHPTRP